MNYMRLAFQSIIGIFCAVQSIAQSNMQYSSGRIFEDPMTGATIHSPYVALDIDGKNKWIAYDPNALEGRFLDVVSFPEGAVTCGYVSGSFKFLGKEITGESNEQNGVVICLNSNKQMQWSYYKPKGLYNNLIRLQNGNTIVSGYIESDENALKVALLICINNKGEVVWEKELNDAKGFQLRLNEEEDLYWHLAKSSESNYHTYIQSINTENGELKKEIYEPYSVEVDGLKGNISLEVIKGGLVTARKIEDQKNLTVAAYHNTGTIKWQTNVLSFSEDLQNIDVQDIVMNSIGNVWIAINLRSKIKLLPSKQELMPIGESDILLLTLNEEGELISYEQYGSGSTTVNSFYKHETRFGIAGAYRNELRVQDQFISSEMNTKILQAYSILLDENKGLTPIRNTNSTLVRNTNSSFRIYPNPSNTGMVTITNEIEDLNSYYSIQVFDNAGKLLINVGKKPEGKFIKDHLDISSLRSGLYYIKFQQGSQNISSRLIIQ